MSLFSHPDYPNQLVEFPYQVCCNLCGNEHAISQMHIVEWIGFCIKSEGGCGHIWSLENGSSYGFSQDARQ